MEGRCVASPLTITRIRRAPRWIWRHSRQACPLGPCRLLEHCGDEVAERGITPAESARHNGVSWPSAHGAFTRKADAILDDEPEPVAHLGMDEHRRGRARWRKDEETGEYVLVVDRWHTCFYDLSGNQGLLG